MMSSASASDAERLYLVYLARFREIRGALVREDGDALRAAELELPSLPPSERRVVAMAVHDVAARLPRRAKVHFVRALSQEEAGLPR